MTNKLLTKAEAAETWGTHLEFHGLQEKKFVHACAYLCYLSIGESGGGMSVDFLERCLERVERISYARTGHSLTFNSLMAGETVALFAEFPVILRRLRELSSAVVLPYGTFNEFKDKLAIHTDTKDYIRLISGEMFDADSLDELSEKDREYLKRAYDIESEIFISPDRPPEGEFRELLVIWMEELAEVIQRISKMLRFGASEIQPGQPLNNIERTLQEMGDVDGVIDELVKKGYITWDADQQLAHRLAKQAKLVKFLQSPTGPYEDGKD